LNGFEYLASSFDFLFRFSLNTAFLVETSPGLSPMELLGFLSVQIQGATLLRDEG